MRLDDFMVKIVASYLRMNDADFAAAKAKAESDFPGYELEKPFAPNKLSLAGTDESNEVLGLFDWIEPLRKLHVKSISRHEHEWPSELNQRTLAGFAGGVSLAVTF